MQVGFYLPPRFQGSHVRNFLKPWNPLVRFSPFCVIKHGASFLDIGSEIGMSSALVARTPGVRITAVEPNSSLRKKLKNLASICSLCSDVPTPPWSLLHSPGSISEAVNSDAYAKFVVDIMKEVAPGVIRINGIHAGKFVPLICFSSSARYVVFEPPGSLPSYASLHRSLELLQANQWKIVQLPSGKRVSPDHFVFPHRFMCVAGSG